MDDSSHDSINKNAQVPIGARTKTTSQHSLSISSHRTLLPKTFEHFNSWRSVGLRKESVVQLGFFLLKAAALEVIRRLSKAKCPLIWKALQGFHILSYPPLSLLKRWEPLRPLIEGSQKMSKPLLLLSIATIFTDLSDNGGETSRPTVDSSESSLPCPDPPVEQPLIDLSLGLPEPQEIASSESWLMQLKEELQKQGVAIPDRIHDDELRRFYKAANGDFAHFLLSIKKTIKWRENYYILSVEELKLWSHVVFWHGYDVKSRPCLIIRLGLGCMKLKAHLRPHFAQAVVSSIEHGIVNLVNGDDPRITVVMDCDGVSAFRFPMNLLKSCSTLFQENYPDRLASMYIVRLPPVVRVIAQTFIQMLKPITRQKLHIQGVKYHKMLSENLETIPLFLGGQCSCAKCLPRDASGTPRKKDECSQQRTVDVTADDDFVYETYLTDDFAYDNSYDTILRSLIFVMLMILIFIGLIAGIYDPEM